MNVIIIILNQPLVEHNVNVTFCFGEGTSTRSARCQVFLNHCLGRLVHLLELVSIVHRTKSDMDLRSKHLKFLKQSARKTYNLRRWPVILDLSRSARIGSNSDNLVDLITQPKLTGI